MKKILIMITILISGMVSAQEISLFNSNGDAVAYIDVSDDRTIYLWDGEPVAYLESDNVWGFNGDHLGWFEDGIIMDHKGNAVGFVDGALSLYTNYEGYKGYKDFKPFKDFQDFEPYKPYYSSRFSILPLSLFLSSGI